MQSGSGRKLQIPIGKQPSLSNLEGADLRNLDFSEADLTGANLNLSWLSGTEFHQAKVKHAQFKFCTGITNPQKERLCESGATVRWRLTPWAWKIGGLILLGLLTGIHLYLTDIDHMNLATLQYHRQKTVTLGDSQKTFEYDMEIRERHASRGSWRGYFLHSLEAASLLRRSENHDRSQDILEELLQNPTLDHQQKAQVLNELARIHIDLKDPKAALELLKNIDLENLNTDILFKTEMNRALAYRRNDHPEEALKIYMGLLKKAHLSSQNKQRLSNQIRLLEKRNQK